MPKTSNVGEASRLLAEYEDRNRDLPEWQRRQLAPFALYPKVTLAALESLFGRPFGQTLHRHRPWLLWEALATSTLAPLWRHVAALHNSIGLGLRSIYYFISEASDPEPYRTFSYRMGATYPISPRSTHSSPPSVPPAYLWAKGGGWHRNSNYTKIIFLGEHLPLRDHSFSTLTAALTPAACEQLETELHHTIDPDAQLHPDAISSAISYVRTRIPDLAGWHGLPQASFLTASWFFQRRVTNDDGLWVYWRSPNFPPTRRYDRSRPVYSEWLP